MTMTAYARFVCLFSTALLLFTTRVSSQEEESFTCDGDPLTNDFSLLLDNFEFDKIDTRYGLESGSKQDVELVPSRVHWHIYVLPDEDDAGVQPYYAAYPQGWVVPIVRRGELSFEIPENALKDQGYDKGDSIEAAINLYVPSSQLSKVSIGGVDKNVEIEMGFAVVNNNTTTAPLIIKLDGVDNTVSIDSASYLPIQLDVSGVDNRANVLGAASRSQVELSGVDNRVELHTSPEGSVSKIRMSGVDSYLLVEGSLDRDEASGGGDFSLSGVDARLRLNGDTCQGVKTSGVDPNCDTSTGTVALTSISCLAESKVVKYSSSCGWDCDWTTWQIIGMSLGILAVVGCCLGGFLYCCGCLKRGRRRGEQPPQPSFDKSGAYPQAEATASVVTTTAAPVMATATAEPMIPEAQVIEVKSQPYNDDDTTDPEQAIHVTGPQAKVY